MGLPVYADRSVRAWCYDPSDFRITNLLRGPERTKEKLRTKINAPEAQKSTPHLYQQMLGLLVDLKITFQSMNYKAFPARHGTAGTEVSATARNASTWHALT